MDSVPVSHDAVSDGRLSTAVSSRPCSAGHRYPPAEYQLGTGNQGLGTGNQGRGTESGGLETENQGLGTENQGLGTENQDLGTGSQLGVHVHWRAEAGNHSHHVPVPGMHCSSFGAGKQ